MAIRLNCYYMGYSSKEIYKYRDTQEGETPNGWSKVEGAIFLDEQNLTSGNLDYTLLCRVFVCHFPPV